MRKNVFSMKGFLLVATMVAGLAYAPAAFAWHAQIVPARAEHERNAEVSIWKSDFSNRTRFQTFGASQSSQGFLSAGDLDGDGRAELVIGAGAGSPPEVRVYTADGKLLRSFLAYHKAFKGGVRVSVADLDGDGKAEIVTAPGPGMEPLVRKFEGDGSYIVPNGVLAYGRHFQAGVHVAAGDLDGDGKAEIVTTPGPGGGPHVRTFSGALQPVHQDFFAFGADMRDGITPAILRTPEGPTIAISIESWSEPIVKLYRKEGDGFSVKGEFLAFESGWRSGASVYAVDLNGDGFDEIAAHGNGGSTAELRFLDRNGNVLGKYLVQDPLYRGSLSVAQIDQDGDGKTEIATVSNQPVVVGPLDQEKAVHVHLGQQRLYAYERGRLVNTFLISSGTWKYPTPVLETKVQSKTPIKRYRWSYGPGHPDNYDLPNVRWNLQIFGPYYIHGTYWHSNFGHRMSHGCINLRNSDAEWIYGWAEEGTSVRTFYQHPSQNEELDKRILATL